MKIYVITHLAAEENYTPIACKTKERAKEIFDELVEALLIDEDENLLESSSTMDSTYFHGKRVSQWVGAFDVYEDFADITWQDDTYDTINIFELEVEE